MSINKIQLYFYYSKYQTLVNYKTVKNKERLWRNQYPKIKF